MGIPARPSEIGDRQEILGGGDRVSLGRRVEVHDDTHLELKLDYGLPLRGRKVDYEVQIHAYFPGSLNVNDRTYPKQDFFQDIQAYLRFKTPEFSVDDLLDPGNQDSPLARIARFQRRLERLKGLADRVADRLQEEAKLYGSLVRSYLRNKLARLTPFIELYLDDEAGFYDRDRLEDSIVRFEGKARALLDGFRKVRDSLEPQASTLPPRVAVCLEQVDEYLSFQYERIFCALLVQVERADPMLERDIRRPLLEGLNLEREYRLERGYHPGPAEDHDNETFTHRMRLLKKYVGSALYLDMRQTVPREAYTDWIGALAAGLAMLFATVSMVALDAQPSSLANTWVIFLVVLIYIFKDRIKELVKRRMTADGFGGWFPDLDTRIIDVRRKAVLGRCRETLRWLGQKDIPPLVERIRSFRSYSHRELRRDTGETILRYDKVVTLYPSKIHRTHNRRGDLNDIIRIDLARFRRHMDNPEVGLLTLSPEGDRVLPVLGNKTYSLNLILRYALAGGESMVEKIRVVLDRDGIKRVETVIPPCSEDELRRFQSKEAIEEWMRTAF